MNPRELMHKFEIDAGIDQLLQKLDTDNNGQVDFEEFASFLFKEDHELDTALHKSGNRSLSSCLIDVVARQDTEAKRDLKMSGRAKSLPGSATCGAMASNLTLINQPGVLVT